MLPWLSWQSEWLLTTRSQVRSLLEAHFCSRVAELVEHGSNKPRVEGSNPFVTIRVIII